MNISTHKEDIILVFEPKLSTQVGFIVASIFLGFNKANKKGEYSGLLRTVFIGEVSSSDVNNADFLNEIKTAISSGTVRLIQKNIIIFISPGLIHALQRFPIYISDQSSRKILKIRDVQNAPKAKDDIGDSLLYFKQHTLYIRNSYNVAAREQFVSPHGVIRIEKILKDVAYVSFHIAYGEYLVEELNENELKIRDLFAEEKIIERINTSTFKRKDAFYVCKRDELHTNLNYLSEFNFKVFKGNDPAIIARPHYNCASSPSGMDWFELSGDFTVGENSIDLVCLARALKNPQGWVEIDKSTLLIPPALEKLLKESEISSTGIKVPVKAYALLQSVLDEGNILTNTAPASSPFSISQIRFSIETDIFQGTLRPYQEIGVRWLIYIYKNKIGGVLGDEMGLGKTIQAIYAVCILTKKSRDPILVVCPKTLLFNWEREFKKFAPQIQCDVYHGQGRKIQQQSQVILSTYGTLVNDIEEISKIKFSFTFFDEAQIIKNPKTRTHKKCLQINAQAKIALTGTPIENSIRDLWAIYHLVFPQYFGSFAEFSTNFKSDSEYEVLKRYLDPVLLRRKKSDVLTDLPPKIIQTVYSEMGPKQQELYNSLVLVVKTELEKQNASHTIVNASIAVLNGLLRLRQLCCHPLLLPHNLNYSHVRESAKFEQFCTLLDSLLEQEEKVVVFSEFTSMLSIMEKYLLKQAIQYQRLDGSTRDRKAVVTNFETGGFQVLLVSIKAGGVGINITSAHNVILYDPWWNPAVENQAIDRLHRIGQKLPVTVYKLITANSIEEKIQKLQIQKSDLFQAVLESEDVDINTLLIT